MTNHEAIKRMSKEEMAAVFYMFVKPMMDALNMDEGQKNSMRNSIRSFLEAEVVKK